MRLRKTDANNDYVFGRSLNAFWQNQPEGVAQLCVSRLQLYGGSWWYDLTEGMFWEPKVIGWKTNRTRDPAIKARILGTQGVIGIVQYSSNLDRQSRDFTLTAIINTTWSVGPLTTQFSANVGPA